MTKENRSYSAAQADQMEPLRTMAITSPLTILFGLGKRDHI